MSNMMHTINIKTKDEMEIMAQGGKKLSEVKKEVSSFIKPGINALQVEELVTSLIEERGGKTLF